MGYSRESDRLRITVAVESHLLAYTFSLLASIDGIPTGIRKLDRVCDKIPIIRMKHDFHRLSCITTSSRLGNKSIERALALFFREKKVPKRQPRRCGVSVTCK